MIRPSPTLAAFEARYERDAFHGLSHADALAWFSALWAEACALNPDVGSDWLHDLDAALAVARAVNDLPPAA